MTQRTTYSKHVRLFRWYLPVVFLVLFFALFVLALACWAVYRETEEWAIFLIASPFFLVNIAMIYDTISRMVGRIEIEVADDQLSVIRRPLRGFREVQLPVSEIRHVVFGKIFGQQRMGQQEYSGLIRLARRDGSTVPVLLDRRDDLMKPIADELAQQLGVELQTAPPRVGRIFEFYP